MWLLGTLATGVTRPLASVGQDGKFTEVDGFPVTKASTWNSRAGFDTGRLQAKLYHRLTGLEDDQGKRPVGIATHGKKTMCRCERKLNRDLDEFIQHIAWSDG